MIIIQRSIYLFVFLYVVISPFSWANQEPLTVVVVTQLETNGKIEVGENHPLARMVTTMVTETLTHTNYKIIDTQAYRKQKIDESHLVERSIEDTSMAARQIAHRYQADIAVIMRLQIKTIDALQSGSDELTKSERTVYKNLYDHYWYITVTVQGRAYTKNGTLLFAKPGVSYREDDGENRTLLTRRLTRKSTIQFIGSIPSLAAIMENSRSRFSAEIAHNRLNIALYGFRNMEQLLIFEQALRDPQEVTKIERKFILSDADVETSNDNRAEYEITFKRSYDLTGYQQHVVKRVDALLAHSKTNPDFKYDAIRLLNGIDLLSGYADNVIRFHLSYDNMQAKSDQKN